MTITLPPSPEQKAIAAVLSSLDDKIGLLHRQNQTLEAMAATLFRQWFVERRRRIGKRLLLMMSPVELPMVHMQVHLL
jgi:type I restriction enzyme S subunit